MGDPTRNDFKLRRAVEEGRVQTVRCLLKCKHVRLQRFDKQTVWKAVCNGHIEIVRMLSTKMNLSRDMLKWAAIHGHVKLVEILLTGMKPTLKAFQWAFATGQHAVCKMLVGAGLKVTKGDLIKAGYLMVCGLVLKVELVNGDLYWSSP